MSDNGPQTAGPATSSSDPGTPPINRVLVFGVVLAAVLEILDITIVNVSLPHMMGAFGASPDQITWVLSSYLVSQAIVMPLTGYLSRRLGRSVLLNTAVIGFIISSVLCGLSWNLESMIVFRLAQGVFGATLIPLAQSILYDAFPRDQAGRAMAVFGLGIMVAPVFGPTLGGWLTENYEWRMIFFINIPLGMISLAMVFGQIKSNPCKDIRTDWIGLALMATAIGSLQLMVDQGQTMDWFNSKFIQVLAFLCFATGLLFFVRGWGKRNNIIDLSLFKDRNFAAASASIFFFSFGMFGTIGLLPLLTQRLIGYSPLTSGMLFIPRALASAITMIIVGGYIIKKVDARYIIACGLVASGIGPLLMTNYTLGVDKYWLMMPGVVIGIGAGMFFVPLTTMAFDRIPPDKMDEATGIFSLMRALGASIGVAIISWLFVDHTQAKWNALGSHVTPFSPEMQTWLGRRGLEFSDPQAVPAIAMEIGRQAQMLAFIDMFWLIGWVTLGILPLLFVMQKSQKASEKESQKSSEKTSTVPSSPKEETPDPKKEKAKGKQAEKPKAPKKQSKRKQKPKPKPKPHVSLMKALEKLPSAD